MNQKGILADQHIKNIIKGIMAPEAVSLPGPFIMQVLRAKQNSFDNKVQIKSQFAIIEKNGRGVHYVRRV